MQIEIAEPISERKHHHETPTDLVPMQEEYLDKNVPIDPADVKELIERYATDYRVDLYTLADVLNLTRSQLSYLLKKPEFQSAYQEARKRRGDILALKGLEVALTPYEKLVNGEHVDKVMVNAAKVASNYMLLYARSFNSDLSPAKNNGDTAVNIQINVPNLPKL